ncbi:MAG: DUF3021 domain-containing protein [Bacillota bacterium]
MKRQVFLRGLLGFPLGIAMGYIITIIISLALGQGYYSPCVPSLAETVGSEVGAVVLQAGLSGLLGASFAAASVVWEMEAWGIAKQTGIYFLIASLTMLPIAYFAEWMAHTVTGFFVYFGIFLAIFIVAWICQYGFWKQKIKNLNAKIGKQ